MRKEYDFSHARPNPYAKRLKRSVTIRLDDSTIAYFKELAVETGIPYQTLINSYLRDCAATGRRPTMRWSEAKKGAAYLRAPADGRGPSRAMRPRVMRGRWAEEERAVVTVSYEDLSAAFDFVSFGAPMEHQAFVALDTGAIYWVSESDSLDEEVPEDLDTSDRYIAIRQHVRRRHARG